MRFLFTLLMLVVVASTCRAAETAAAVLHPKESNLAVADHGLNELLGDLQHFLERHGYVPEQAHHTIQSGFGVVFRFRKPRVGTFHTYDHADGRVGLSSEYSGRRSGREQHMRVWRGLLALVAKNPHYTLREVGRL